MSGVNKIIHNESLPYEFGVFYTQLLRYKVWNEEIHTAVTSCVYSETSKFDITNPLLSRKGQGLPDGLSDSEYEWTAQIQPEDKVSSGSPLVVKLRYNLSQGTVTLINTGEVLPFDADFTYVVSLRDTKEINGFVMLSESEENVPLEVGRGLSKAKFHRKKLVVEQVAALDG